VHWQFGGLLLGLSRNTLLLAGGSLFADLATEMLTPILPVFLTQTLKANGSVVGLIDGIAQALRNIVDGFFGPISDRLRSRKPIALLGYALAALGKPLMGFSTGWQGVLAGRLLDRSGAGTFAAPRDALVSFSADERHRGRGFALGLGR
jgi:MFS family permease